MNNKITSDKHRTPFFYRYPPGFGNSDPAERPSDDQVDAWTAQREEALIEAAEYDHGSN